MAKVTEGGNKVLAPTERRYVAKQQGEGRRVSWGVYDRQKACWPFAGPEWGGKVQQSDHTEQTAQAEADRLEAMR